MANTDVGSAYVEIEPKLKDGGKGLKKEIEGIDAKPDGRKVGEGVGDGVSEGVSAKAVAIGTIVANVVTAAAKKAAEIVGSVIGGAFENYANWEQLTGGVEKLFGDASGEVMQFASEAYKTAGLSANSYMEQVTGFSASLIGSLGNDTTAAAQYADMAIRDMSDNANVFGTDIASIQQAYQGFARGNFTMLDNLRLGYGGTKSEMERLIADANAVKVANGEMADLSIDSFADITEAIHIMQGEMDIAGTTSAEAAGTIEGSINSLKAAWQNWLTGLGDENADMSQLTDSLVQSLKTAAENVIPRLGEILGTLLQELPDLISSVLAELPDLAETVVSALFGEDAGAKVREVIETFGPPLLEILKFVGPLIPIIAGVSQVMGPIMQMLPVIQAALPVIGTVIGALTSPIGLVVAAIAAVVGIITYLWNTNEGFREAVTAIWEGIVSAFQTAGGVIVGIIDGFEAVISGAVEVFTSLFTGAAEIIQTAWGALVEFFRGIPVKITGFFSGIGHGLSQGFATAKQLIIGYAQGIVSFWAGVPGKILGFFSGIGEGISSFFRNIKLPHFSIQNASLNPKDWITNGLPKLSVEWYATGGIVDGATLIGAGEKGREGIIPLENRQAMQPFAVAVADNLADAGELGEVLQLLREIRDKDTDIYIDRDRVGRALTPAINRNIGNNAVMSSRGRAAYAF